jgi:flagellar hook-associated protein 3 FlgL
MTTRVSSFGGYQAALLDLMAAENRAMEAQDRVSTEKIATDLTGFGRQAETLTALKSAQSRIQGFIDSGEAVAARLSSQDLAFERIGDAAQAARQAIADGLAAGRLDGLMLELGGHFQAAQDGINAKHQDRYLFSGGDVAVAPVETLSLAQLADAPSTASVIRNGDLRQASRLDEGTTLETGFLAEEVAGPLFDLFRSLQLYSEGSPVTLTVNGVAQTFTPTPADQLTGAPTENVQAFLKAALQGLDDARGDITDMAARNGSMQNRTDAVLAAHDRQKIALQDLMGDKTDVDMAQALTDLELSQIAIQASAQVISQLRQASLLNFLN